MGEFTKRRIGEDLLPLEEQPGPKKPNMVKPFSHNASSFQPWKPFGKKGLGIVDANNKTKPNIQNTINSNTSAAQDCNNMNIEDSTLDNAKKNLIIGEGAISDEPQGDCSTISQMDPKRLKRILANRASAQRSRIRKMEYMDDLEEKAKSYQDKIAFLQPQLVAYKNRQRLLLIEQHKLKLQMAAREKERILQEVEIEKNKEEVNRLSGLHRKLIVEARARMVNMGAPMQLMPNTSSFGCVICLNSGQAQNAIGTSRMQVDMDLQQSQIQSQMRMDKWNNRQRSTPNSTFVKSEPAA